MELLLFVVTMVLGPVAIVSGFVVLYGAVTKFVVHHEDLGQRDVVGIIIRVMIGVATCAVGIAFINL